MICVQHRSSVSSKAAPGDCDDHHDDDGDDDDDDGGGDDADGEEGPKKLYYIQTPDRPPLRLLC